MNKGRVVKSVGGHFTVSSNGQVFDCLARGKLKRNGAIYVGDFVNFDKDSLIVEKVLKRENSMIRPMVSNIDNVLIVIAPIPSPDFYLIDKLIINCHMSNIKPILCYNKIDIQDNELVEKIKAQYSNVLPIHFISSTLNQGIEELKEALKGEFTCLAGQSAVGKSSLLNILLKDNIAEVGEVSRIERGRNTTRHIEIFELDKDILIADTCGFSSLETVSMPPEDLRIYYDEYMEIADGCKYQTCNHINEPYCAVKEDVQNGNLNATRYERYKTIYNDLKDKWSKRYE